MLHTGHSHNHFSHSLSSHLTSISTLHSRNKMSNDDKFNQEDDQEGEEDDDDKPSPEKKPRIDYSPPLSDRICMRYTDDLYQFHLQIEAQRRPESNYVKRFERSSDSDEYLNVQNRISLIDRLVQDVISLNLREDTLYLAISILDRYWSFKAIEIGQMVLAPSCLFIAAKLEETTEFEATLLCSTGKDVLAQGLIQETGTDIFQSLKFDIWSPTTITFLWRFTHIDDDCHPELEQLGCCLAELSLLDYYYVQFLPSMIAASVVFLGKFILNSKKHPWSKSLQSGTGYSPSDLRECILRLDHFQKDAKHRDEIKRSSEKFAGVTSLPFEPSIPDDYFHTSED